MSHALPLSMAARPRLPYELRREHRCAPGELIDLSIVAPAYDEEANLRPLVEAVRTALSGDLAWELVLVDDGSRDGTAAVIDALSAEDPRVTGVMLAENLGQTGATAAGIGVARGRLIATIDADLQNDPSDLPRMIDELHGANADAVVGVRVRRQDGFVRRASSRVANSIRRRLSGDSFHDTGCGIKLFRAEALEALPLFEGLHRFLPTLLGIHGFTVRETPVAHHPRRAGRSKYGTFGRALRGGRDLMAVRWMRSRVLRIPVERIEGRRGAPSTAHSTRTTSSST